MFGPRFVPRPSSQPTTRRSARFKFERSSYSVTSEDGGPPRNRAQLLSFALSCATLTCLTLSCGVPAPPDSTGGVELNPGECGRGLLVVSTDYQSSNVSLLDPQGNVLSSSFISSASTQVGLSAPLSGDVVPPSSPLTGDRAVLLDRYPASVISWVDLTTASVSAQLSVATGFGANPHDYAELSPELAYVSRFEANPAPGQQPHDQGNDVLVIDPSVPRITGRIDLLAALGEGAQGFLPRADKLKLVGNSLYVLASGYSADFGQSLPSRIIRVDTTSHAIQQVVVLEGLHGCAGLALSPSGRQLAVSCSGPFNDSTELPTTSGIALVNLQPEAELAQVLFAKDLVSDPVAYSIDYLSDQALVFTTFGRFDTAGQPRQDGLYQLDLESGRVTHLLASSELPFSLGDVRCTAACGTCFVTDAVRGGGVVHRFELGEPVAAPGEPGDQQSVVSATLRHSAQTRPDTLIGLPPRYLGAY